VINIFDIRKATDTNADALSNATYTFWVRQIESIITNLQVLPAEQFSQWLLLQGVTFIWLIYLSKLLR